MRPEVMTAVDRLFGHEGIYSEDPNDRGGETVYGIARNKHPNLPLWKYVDLWNKKKPIPLEIIEAVWQFYEGWWLASQADFIFAEIPKLAYEYFYASVNCGKGAAGKMLQRSLNMLNRNQLDYPDIDEDGKVGRGTIAAFHQLVSCPARPVEVSRRLLRKQFNVRLGDYYNDLYLQDPGDERYIGWLDRVWAEG